MEPIPKSNKLRALSKKSIHPAGSKDHPVRLAGFILSRVGNEHEVVGDHGIQLGAFHYLDGFDVARQELDDGTPAPLGTVLVDGLEGLGAAVGFDLEGP